MAWRVLAASKIIAGASIPDRLVGPPVRTIHPLIATVLIGGSVVAVVVRLGLLLRRRGDPCAYSSHTHVHVWSPARSVMCIYAAWSRGKVETLCCRDHWGWHRGCCRVSKDARCVWAAGISTSRRGRWFIRKAQ